jgi:hypothetical protein
LNLEKGSTGLASCPGKGLVGIFLGSDLVVEAPGICTELTELSKDCVGWKATGESCAEPDKLTWEVPGPKKAEGAFELLGGFGCIGGLENEASIEKERSGTAHVGKVIPSPEPAPSPLGTARYS